MPVSIPHPPLSGLHYAIFVTKTKIKRTNRRWGSVDWHLSSCYRRTPVTRSAVTSHSGRRSCCLDDWLLLHQEPSRGQRSRALSPWNTTTHDFNNNNNNNNNSNNNPTIFNAPSLGRNVASRRRRSANLHRSIVPQYRRSTLSQRAFSVGSPTVWNSLALELCEPTVSNSAHIKDDLVY